LILWIKEKRKKKEKKHYDSAVDVYSFGMVIYEMVSRNSPFADVNNLLQLKETVCDKKQRPPVPHDTLPLLSSLMMSCWQHEPKKRPTFNEIVTILAANNNCV